MNTGLLSEQARMKVVLFAYLAIMSTYGYNMALVKEVNAKAQNWVGGVNTGIDNV